MSGVSVSGSDVEGDAALGGGGNNVEALLVGKTGVLERVAESDERMGQRG